MLAIATPLIYLLAAAPQAAAPTGPASPDKNGFIRDWLLLAPVFYDPLWPAGAEEIDKQQVRGEAFARPRVGESVRVGAETLTWKAATTNGFALDLAAASGTAPKSFVLGYAVAYVVADKPVSKARLRLGTNDFGKVYFNGKPVLRHDVVRALARDQNGAFVDLKKGVNVLVAKVINDENKWELAARFVGEGGQAVPGLRVASQPDGGGALADLDAEGFVRTWLVLGPIAYKPRPYARGQLHRKHIAGEEKLMPRAEFSQWVAGHPMRWKPYRAGQAHIDFFEHLHKHRELVPQSRWEANDSLFNTLGYAVTYVHAREELRDVVVKIGANDHGKVYVNGKPAAAWDEPGPLVPDKASGKVTLRKGVNVVVFKIVNAGDNWQGCLRFVDRAGQPLTDLEVQLTPPPQGEELAVRD